MAIGWCASGAERSPRQPTQSAAKPYVLPDHARAAPLAAVAHRKRPPPSTGSPGRVDRVSAPARRGAGAMLVALGGGRVIDVAEALAAADPPRRVAAVPATLSAAE